MAPRTMAWRQPAVDAGLVGLVLGLSLAMLARGGFGEVQAGARALDAPGVLLAVASALPLVWRRAAPLAVYAVTSAAGAALVAWNYPYDVPLGPAVAVYALAVAHGGDPRPRWRWGAILAIAMLVPTLAVAFAAGGHDVADSLVPEFAAVALFTAAVWIAGDRTRLRHERIAELEERDARSRREAERGRRLAAAEERTRIARELHDSAGHAINVILVQAGAARLLHERDPEASRRAISTIEQVARGTIGEIDRLVRALRDHSSDPLAPADPAALDLLVDRHRATGLRIATDIRGTRRALPRSVAWAAHRILQEALTNAARHGGGSAEVVVEFGPDAVDLSVTNPTRTGGPAGGGGHGIVGMRERAILLGGTLVAGGDGDGVYRLRARLPYGEAGP